jgi:hypothetical protein
MTGFLGGIDLGSPADRNKRTFMRELSSRAEQNIATGRFPQSEGYRYPGGGAELILRHGQFYPGRELPDRYKHLRGAMSECFHNALVAAEAMPELQYCEGYCYTGHSYAFNHGWCIAPDGGVVEVTAATEWAEIQHYHNEEMLPFMPAHTWAYYGVIVATPFMRAVWDYPGTDLWDVPLFERHSQERARTKLTPEEMGEPTVLPFLKMTYDPTRTTLP